MSKFNIEISEPAGNDLYKIRKYIAEELLEPDIARKVVSKIGSAILELEEMPLRNSLVADERLALLSYPKLLIGSYIVFYIVSETNKTVTIVRILYNRRDWTSLL